MPAETTPIPTTLSVISRRGSFSMVNRAMSGVLSTRRHQRSRSPKEILHGLAIAHTRHMNAKIFRVGFVSAVLENVHDFPITAREIGLVFRGHGVVLVGDPPFSPVEAGLRWGWIGGHRGAFPSNLAPRASTNALSSASFFCRSRSLIAAADTPQNR